MTLKSQTKRNWVIRNSWLFTVVQAPSAAEALAEFMESFGYQEKPWLAESLDVHEASLEELRRYAALADAQRRSETTAATVKRKAKNVHQRLGVDQEPML